MGSFVVVTETSVSLRAVVREDEPFLRQLFIESRRAMYPDLAADHVEEVLALQHVLWTRQVQGFFPEAVDHVVEVDGAAVGRVLVDVRDHDVHLVDIAVLESARRRGTATEVLVSWTEVADELGATVTTHVVGSVEVPDHLQQMGFVRVDVDAVGIVARRPAWMDRG